MFTQNILIYINSNSISIHNIIIIIYLPCIKNDNENNIFNRRYLPDNTTLSITPPSFSCIIVDPVYIAGR